MEDASPLPFSHPFGRLLNMRKVCIICAIHQESNPILRSLPRAKKSLIAGIPAWETVANGDSIHLLQSGIGLNKASRAARIAADLLKPDLVVNAGFCGALFSGLDTGDIIAAEKLYHYSSGIISQDAALDLALPEPLQQAGEPAIRQGVFISTENTVDKYLLINHIKHLATPSTVLEMESWSISEVCRERGIRFAAIRAVSDPAENDPAELFRNICDNEFNISPAKLSLYLLRNPSMTFHLIQLANNAKIAGRRLADAVQVTLRQIK
jgi:adenosylhomocysteine nucleosidase